MPTDPKTHTPARRNVHLNLNRGVSAPVHFVSTSKHFCLFLGAKPTTLTIEGLFQPNFRLSRAKHRNLRLVVLHKFDIAQAASLFGRSGLVLALRVANIVPENP